MGTGHLIATHGDEEEHSEYTAHVQAPTRLVAGDPAARFYLKHIAHELDTKTGENDLIDYQRKDATRGLRTSQ